jgi:hypothetical protein
MKMKSYKKAALNIAILTMILSAGISSGALAASNFNTENDANIEVSQPKKQKQEKILNTFENNDYEAWKQIIGKNSKLSSLVDAENFKLFVSARQAARQGEYAKAVKITESIKKSLNL